MLYFQNVPFLFGPPYLSDAHKLRVRCSYQSHEWPHWVWSPGTPGLGKKAAWPAHSPLHHPCPARPAPGGSRTWRGPTGRVRHRRGGSRPTTPRSSEGHLGWCPAYLDGRKGKLPQWMNDEWCFEIKFHRSMWGNCDVNSALVNVSFELLLCFNYVVEERTQYFLWNVAWNGNRAP